MVAAVAVSERLAKIRDKQKTGHESGENMQFNATFLLHFYNAFLRTRRFKNYGATAGSSGVFSQVILRLQCPWNLLSAYTSKRGLRATRVVGYSGDAIAECWEANPLTRLGFYSGDSEPNGIRIWGCSV